MNTAPKSIVASACSAAVLLASYASAATTSMNSGSLGAAADGVNSDGVVLGVPGPLAAGGDVAAGYSGGERTSIPYLASLNPSSDSPFTIEFWARPSASDGDDAPLSNRWATGDRSGWVFFQRGESEGWNFRMYNGEGGGLAWDLTGGTSTLDAYSHVVVTWTGSAAVLYVNGMLADDTNAPGATGIYNPNSAINSPVFSIGANADGGSPSNAFIDEVAFYPSALTADQIAAHYSAAGSPVAGFYSALVLADGASLYLQNIPEPSAALLIAVGALAGVARRRRTI